MLETSPEVVRSGIVYSGKIYETEGGEAVGIHEGSEVQALPPIGRPSAVRLFESSADGSLAYRYANPGAIIGPNTDLPFPAFARNVVCIPHLAFVISQNFNQVNSENAEEVILGFTILNLFKDRELEAQGLGARAEDFLIAVGPVLVTPDELEDFSEFTDRGTQLNLNASFRLNGIERARASTRDLNTTVTQAIVAAGNAAVVGSGDLFAIAPIFPDLEFPVSLEPGDEIQVALEVLGTLTTRISEKTEPE